jgi:tetratricopeptide (TPR) repeat protein
MNSGGGKSPRRTKRSRFVLKIGPLSTDGRVPDAAPPPVAAAVLTADNDRALFGAAVHALREGRAPDAALLLMETIRSRPAAVHYRTAFAEVLLALDNPMAAWRTAQRATAIEPASAQGLFIAAAALRTLGHPFAAVRLLLRALRLDPGFAHAHLDLGAILESEGRFGAAILHYREAGRSDASLADPHIRLASLHHRLGQPGLARACYVEALNRRPGDGALWANLAATLADLGESDGSLACYGEAFRLVPTDVAARNNHALLLLRLGQLERSRAAFATAVTLDPGFSPAWQNAALAEAALGGPERAIILLHRAVSLTPDQGHAWNGLGQALRAAGHGDRATSAWRAALAVDPRCVEAMGNLAADRSRHESFADAERLVHRALATIGTDARLLAVLTQVMLDQARYPEAERLARFVLTLDPAHADTMCNLGLANDHLDRNEGLAWFSRAIAVSPEHALAQFNRGLALLRDGALAEGWRGYAHRFAAGRVQPVRRFTVPEWDGAPLAGRRLFVWREQGVGDEFLFASCYPDVVKMAERTIIECDRRLVSLFQRSFPKAIVRAERPASSPPRVELVDCDTHIPAGSLPALLRSRLPDIPPQRASWLYPNLQRVEEWRGWLGTSGPGLRVGIAWRSRLMTAERRPCYLPLNRWAPVFAVPGTMLVNLQYDDCEDELLDAERQFGRRIHRWPWLDLRDDFESTAALIANLDLVIAPANSVAELAGALGVPVWRFGYRDWTHLGTGARPWYRSMRVFQPFSGERLDAALARIARELPRAAHLADLVKRTVCGGSR